MRIVRGRKVVTDDGAFFAQPHARVVVDVGTGDGRFVYRSAREHPDALWVGVDPVAEAMRESSSKSRRKPAKGGAPNALFVVASIEQLPSELFGVADEITVNYPWGSLLAAVATPVPESLAALVSLGKPGACLRVLLNYSVFEDEDYMTRLGLPPFNEAAVEARLAPALAAVGMSVTHHELRDGPVGEHTSWERRLVAGSRRRTLVIEGKA